MHYTMKQFDPPPPAPPPLPPKTHTHTHTKQQQQPVKVSPRSLQPHQTITVFHQTCYIYRASTTYAQSTRLFNTYVIIFDTADTYGLVIYPKDRINSFESLSEAGIIKQRNTARECIHAHRYTHRGKRKDVLQCCWKRVTNVSVRGDKTCRCDKTCRQNFTI